MIDNDLRLTLDQLAARVGVSARTVRFYIGEGLLPGPSARGKGATYGAEHLLRLRLVRRLVEQHVPLAEIRARVGALSPVEVRALLAAEEQQAARLRRAAEQPSPKEYLSTLLTQARRARQTKEDAPSPIRGDHQPPAGRPPAAAPAEQWQRWQVVPGIELHVRADMAARHRLLIADLLQAISRLNPEDDEAS